MFFDIDDDGLDQPNIFHVVSRELFSFNTSFNNPYTLRSVPTHTEDGIPIRKIYVSNLPPKTTRTELFGVFAQYGFIKSCWLRMGDKGPNKSPVPAYAFITFSNPADAHKALQAPFHEKQLRGRSLRISPADSWHQPSEDAEGRVQWRPNEQRLENITQTFAYDMLQQSDLIISESQSSLSDHQLLENNREDKEDENDVKPAEESLESIDTYNILDILNVDCLNHVLSYLSLRDLIRSERVSKRWQMVAQEYIMGIRVFKTSWWNHVPITMTTAVLRRILQRVGNSLIRLYIDHNWSALNDRTAHTIGKFCPNLEELKVVGMYTKNWNPLIYGCQSLKKLSFISCNKVTDSSLIQIVKSEAPIESLVIANNTHVTGLFLTGTHKPSLTTLSFYNCYSLQGAVLSAALDTLPNITSLRLDVCPITIWKIVPLILKKIPQLLELSLSEYTSMDICLNRTENQEFCDALALLTELKVINFSRNLFITSQVIKQIARTCTKLESFNISSCNATKNVMPGNYAFKGVCDESFAMLCRACVNITQLDVSYLALLTDEGLGHAARLPALRLLTSRGNASLSSQPFADCLAACHRLNEIDVCGCDCLSDEILDAAVRAIDAHPRKIQLMLANTPASQADEIPQHQLLIINTVHDTSNPHLRPDFIDHVLYESSDDSFDGFYDNDDLDFIDPDEEEFFDDELHNFGGIYGLGFQIPRDILLL